MMKKTVVFHSNYSRMFTGFGKNAKNILRYLYKTGKYNIVELSNAKSKKEECLDSLPWKAYGTLPKQEVLNSIREDQGKVRSAAYGLMEIDSLIKEVKPDFYIGVEDIWALTPLVEKKWWNKNCMIWTTLDSVPLYEEAVKIIPKVNHYYAWASFASKEVEKLGYPKGSIKTLRGATEINSFFRLKEEQRTLLRKEFGLSDEFIIGFVFRNQLRKSVPNLMQGFKLFKDKNPNVKAKLLLHTHWSEGWDIVKLIKDNGLKNEDVLTTYFCKKCKQFEVKSFKGQKIKCRFCVEVGSVERVNFNNGVNETQLNEIYNLMVVYCHPFTSGGQEIPVTEAKMTELITLVTNYSCGEDFCTDESGGMALNWKPYFEPGTNFIKATTLPESIADKLERVYKMPKEKRKEMGQRAKKFVVDNLSVEVIGKQLEAIIDSSEPLQWNFEIPVFEKRDPHYIPSSDQSDTEWIIDLYKNILKMTVDAKDEGVKSWLGALSSGRKKEEILEFFKNVARKENAENNKIELSNLLSKDDEGKRILFMMPESAGDVFLSTSLLPSIKNLYPNYNIYFSTKPEYVSMLDGNPHIHKVLLYSPQMENLLTMEGHGEHKGYFDIAFLPHFGTQKTFDYQHNGKDLIELNTRN